MGILLGDACKRRVRMRSGDNMCLSRLLTMDRLDLTQGIAWKCGLDRGRGRINVSLILPSVFILNWINYTHMTKNQQNSPIKSS